jgi:pimeloyl-ACP methyl ester carboxylesterase
MNVVERGVGTPIVLLHGFPVDHHSLLSLDPVIERAGGWRRLYPDLPGMGRTPIGKVASADDVVQAVEKEIDARLGDSRFALLGNSFGGMLARAIAHRRRGQILGLATIAGVFIADRGQRHVPARVVLREDPEAVAVAAAEGAADDYVEIAVVQSVDNARAFLDGVWHGLQVADYEGITGIEENYDLGHRPEESDPFTQPTLFITGRQDDAVGYQDAWAVLEHYPRATFAVLDAAGHNTQVDQVDVTSVLIAEWLARIRHQTEGRDTASVDH